MVHSYQGNPAMRVLWGRWSVFRRLLAPGDREVGGASVLLEKPFSPEVLADAVRKRLDRRASGRRPQVGSAL